MHGALSLPDGGEVAADRRGCKVRRWKRVSVGDAPPPRHILKELRCNRDAVAMLVAERAAREAFHLKAVDDCTVAFAVPDAKLARERAETATATDAEFAGLRAWVPASRIMLILQCDPS
jgi:hypothetical protein